MLSLSPSSYPAPCRWWDPISQQLDQQSSISREIDTITSDSLFPLQFTSSCDPDQAFITNPDHPLITSFTSWSGGGGDGEDRAMVTKLNHNAGERDRRKKINSLYSSLRSLLPADDQAKKLSIPATVSRVLKYIPELQQEVKRLAKEKEDLLSKMSRQAHQLTHQVSQTENGKMHSPSTVVSANQLSEREAVVQISTNYSKVHTRPLSEILNSLEEDGLVLMNSSSFESLGSRVFYNLHFQLVGSPGLECHALSEKLLLLYEKREFPFCEILF